MERQGMAVKHRSAVPGFPPSLAACDCLAPDATQHVYLYFIRQAGVLGALQLLNMATYSEQLGLRAVQQVPDKRRTGHGQQEPVMPAPARKEQRTVTSSTR